MFSQNDLINQLHSKIDSFIQTLDEIIDEKPTLSNNHRHIIPPYLSNQLLKRYEKTKDDLQKEYDEIIELRKKLVDGDNPELSNIDRKINEIQNKLATATKIYEAQKKSNENMARVREERALYPSYKATGEESLKKIEDFFLRNYGVPVTKCDIFEESILQLASVEEKPTHCSYDYLHHDLMPLSLERNHNIGNSIFFTLGLKDPESIKKIMQYGNENKLEPFDYSNQRTKKDANTCKIRMNAQQLIKIALPQIQMYLNDNLSEVVRYHRIINNADKEPNPSLFFKPRKYVLAKTPEETKKLEM